AAPRAATRADHRGPRRARAGGSGSPGRGDRIPARGGGGAGRVTAPASPCTSCARRASLLGLLSIRIAAELSERRRAVPILALSDEELVEAVGGSLKGAAFRLLETFEPARSHAEIEAAGLHAVCRHEPSYPAQLGDLGDRPALLFTSAPPARLAELCEGPAVATLGTRRASAYGLQAPTALGRGLAAAGVTVVSGLALGVDAAAHRGALE